MQNIEKKTTVFFFFLARVAPPTKPKIKLNRYLRRTHAKKKKTPTIQNI